jgi:hypothetical protein
MQLARNRAVGKGFEKTVERKISEAGLDYGEQVTVKTDSGVPYRSDFITRDPATGEIGGVEAKGSATAPLTSNQQRAIP